MARRRLLAVHRAQWRCAGARRALRVDLQSQFPWPPGAQRPHPSDDPGYGRGGGADWQAHGCPPGGARRLSMELFRILDAIAVPIDEVNVDTNQLCPTRFNKVPYGPAYERILFHDRRFDADGREKPDFILNQEPYRSARILVGERNFGCGSSREG